MGLVTDGDEPKMPASVMTKRQVSAAKSLVLDFDLLGKPLMWVRKTNRPNMKFWEAEARNVFYNEVCLFKINLSIIFKNIIRFS